MSAVLEAVDRTLKVRELEVGGATGPLAARLYTAGPAAKRDMLVVYFHGGGFDSGDLDECDDFLRSLAQCDHLPLVLATTYTLATVSPFPAAVEDAHAVLQWAKKNKTKLGWNGKPHAADRSHPYAAPLHSSRLKNLAPALILSAEDDPLRDEAEQYGAKLINAGICTTVRRMAAPDLQDPNGRNECACKVQAMLEISSFLARLEGRGGA